MVATLVGTLVGATVVWMVDQSVGSSEYRTVVVKAATTAGHLVEMSDLQQVVRMVASLVVLKVYEKVGW